MQNRYSFLKSSEIYAISFNITCFVGAGNFVLIPQHTSPDSAVKEIDTLYDVVADVRHRWNMNVNVFLLHTTHYKSPFTELQLVGKSINVTYETKN